ncbi:MAG: hypothetical protein NZZ41_01170 [Candidatus Dojkabacteria bacterium]|nr:hypothetical protein [Candidatus Dojkabacteria bacterium]
MKEKILESLKNVLGEAMNDEVASEISDHIDEIAAKKAENQIESLKEKIKRYEEIIKKKDEEIEKLKEKIQCEEETFKKEAEEFAQDLAEAFAIKEQIMLEEVENFKNEALKAIEESALEYREQVERVVEEVAQEYKEKVQEIALEEAKNFRIEQEAALARDVSKYRKDLLEKIDQYLEAELPKHIPQGIFEAAAKSKAYEGLVNGILETFSRNYIKVDSTGYETLKEAQKKIEQISEQYNAKVREAVSLTAKVRELEKKVKIAEITEGLTRKQREKVYKLLENVNINDVENKLKEIVDLVIQESSFENKNLSKEKIVESHSTTPSNKIPQQGNKPVSSLSNNEYVNKQLEIIESQANLNSAMNESYDPMIQWKKTLDRLNKRI